MTDSVPRTLSIVMRIWDKFKEWVSICISKWISNQDLQNQHAPIHFKMQIMQFFKQLNVLLTFQDFSSKTYKKQQFSNEIW